MTQSTWNPRSEAKHEACRRLQAEGRYETFRKRQAELRKAERGLTKDDSFYKALAEFPPSGGLSEAAPAPEPELRLADDGVALEDILDAGAADVVMDCRWVYENVAAYRDVESANDRDRMRKIELGAPNPGAVGLLRSAASNSNKFHLEVVPKFLAVKETAEEEDPRDRIRRVEMDRLFEQLRELMTIVCPECGRSFEAIATIRDYRGPGTRLGMQPARQRWACAAIPLVSSPPS